jgi:cytochrome P450
MEYPDWSAQAIVVLIAGAVATAGLIVASVYALIKGER